MIFGVGQQQSRPQPVAQPNDSERDPRPTTPIPKTRMAEKTFGKSKRQTVAAEEKAPKWYPSEDVPVPKKVRKTPRPTKLRASLQPGTVLIVLAGRFRGKRVVLLKAIEDTLLVTGPFKVNGVPLRRLNPAYVIATSQKVDVSKVDLSKYDKNYFARPGRGMGKGKKASTKEQEFFGDAKGKKTIDSSRAQDQKTVDKAVVAGVKAVPHLAAYLASTFSLSKGDRPHLMKF